MYALLLEIKIFLETVYKVILIEKVLINFNNNFEILQENEKGKRLKIRNKSCGKTIKAIRHSVNMEAF